MVMVQFRAPFFAHRQRRFLLLVIGRACRRAQCNWRRLVQKNVACELYADASTIEPHHLPIGSAPCAGKGDGTPTITNWGIGIVMPDLAIGVGPTDHNPFGAHQRVRGRCRGKGE